MEFSRRGTLFLRVLVIIPIALIAWSIFLSLAGHTWPDWTGWSDYTGTVIKDNRGKTAWDWMELLIIPAVLAVGALLFNKAEKENDRKLANQRQENEQRLADERNKNEQEISADRMREATLQSYIDRMTELLLDKGLRKSGAEAVVRDVARARTLTTVRMLDPERKGLLVRFLQEAELITKDNPIIKLNQADLSHSFLIDAHLSGANFSGAYLFESFLFGAALVNANLIETNLQGAHMDRAKLSEAKLNKANLIDATLFMANLVGANLSDASLDGATLSNANLSGANLSGAYLGNAKLDGVKLVGATMPDGTIHE
jgi:hypothetical protein